MFWTKLGTSTGVASLLGSAGEQKAFMIFSEDGNEIIIEKTILRVLGAREFSHSLVQKRKCPGSRGTTVLPSGADIVSLPQHVRLVPHPDSCTATPHVLSRSPYRCARAPSGVSNLAIRFELRGASFG
jgi:hypothetical protein